MNRDFIAGTLVGSIWGTMIAILFIFPTLSEAAAVVDISSVPLGGSIFVDQENVMQVSWDDIGDWTTATINIWVDEACTDPGSAVLTGNQWVSGVDIQAYPVTAWSWTYTDPTEFKCVTVGLSGGGVDPDTELVAYSDPLPYYSVVSYPESTSTVATSTSSIDQVQLNLALAFMLFLATMYGIIWLIRKH